MPEVADGETLIGDVLLAVGAESVDESLQWAVAARAAVVLLRDDGENDTVFTGMVEGVAVMVVDPSVTWSDLSAIVYGLVLEGRETESGRGPTDLFALADRLAEVTGGAVTIEDPLLRVLAYSTMQQNADPARISTIMNRQATEPLREFFASQGVFAHLAASDEPLFVSPDAEHGVSGRMVVAVRSGRELMGSLWVACLKPLGEPERTALADGARTVALHLLRSRASADLERQVESELVLRLLTGSPDAAASASRLGLPQGLMRFSPYRRSPDQTETLASCSPSNRRQPVSVRLARGEVRWQATRSTHCFPARMRWPLGAGSRACTRLFRSGSRCSQESAKRPGRPICRRRVMKPTSVLLCTRSSRRILNRRRTTSRGTRFCCNVFARRRNQAARRTADPSLSSAVTTPITPPTTSRL
jgi:hypothetical protein